MKRINVSKADFVNFQVSVFRVRLLIPLFLLLFLLVLVRLFNWQILNTQNLSVIARSQQQISKEVGARRGTIYSSDNFPLSNSRESWLLWASLPQISDADSMSSVLGKLLASEPRELLIDTPDATQSAKTKEDLVREETERIKKLLTKKEAVWVPLKQKISKDMKEKIEILGLKGLGFDPQEDRGYPEASLGAHLLGFVGLDTSGEPKGYFGLEGFYDLTLSGIGGEKAWERDASGKPILLGAHKQIEAINGIDLKTNINRSLQFVLEKNLRVALTRYEASEATAIIMRPDGAVLAMSSLPSYEPERYSLFPSERFVDPAIGESFEPGSIFKILVMASALDQGVVRPDTKCDNCSGPRQIAEYTISSGTKEYYSETTMAEVIEHSDNVGMIWVAEKMGEDSLYEYLTKFGIGSPTGIDLQGEFVPKLRKLKDWTIVDLATASFGQGVAVTPLQMVRAVSVLANGGRLPKPFIVKEIDGRSWKKEIKPEYLDQVISQKAVFEITEMMVKAVESKADMWKKPPGFSIAGKTGTAQIPVSGHYDAEKTIHSFVGYAPANDAKFVMIVSLKDPKIGEFASITAAPTWFGIASEIIPIMGISPD